MIPITVSFFLMRAVPGGPLDRERRHALVAICDNREGAMPDIGYMLIGLEALHLGDLGQSAVEMNGLSAILACQGACQIEYLLLADRTEDSRLIDSGRRGADLSVLCIGTGRQFASVLDARAPSTAAAEPSPGILVPIRHDLLRYHP